MSRRDPAGPAGHPETPLGGDHQNPQPQGHRALPHTADIRLEAWGPTREACLGEAVAALAESFVDASTARTTTALPVDLGRADDEGLLVALLDEALYLLDTLGVVAIAARVSPRPEGGLTGWFDTVPVDAARQVGSVPKAITRGGLSFGCDPETGTWRCRVTVDV